MAGRVRQRRAHLGVVLATAAAIAIAIPTAAPGVFAPPPVSAAPTTAAYQPVGPVRVADTRRTKCGCTRLNSSTVEVDISGHPDLPNDAVAVAITVTATRTASPGYVTVYPAGTPRPFVSTLNTQVDRAVANSAIIPLEPNGRIALFQLIFLENEVFGDKVNGTIFQSIKAASGSFFCET